MFNRGRFLAGIAAAASAALVPAKAGAGIRSARETRYFDGRNFVEIAAAPRVAILGARVAVRGEVVSESGTLATGRALPYTP